MYQIQISSAARNDLADSFLWYEKQQKDLGNEFLQEVFLTIDLIEEKPFCLLFVFLVNFVLARSTGFHI